MIDTDLHLFLPNLDTPCLPLPGICRKVTLDLSRPASSIMPTPMAKGSVMKMDKMKIERSSGNVFSDLGCPDAEAHVLNAELVIRIDEIIRQRGLKQVEAAKLLGLSQPDVSRLLQGSFREYSLERLLRLLMALGRDVEIAIRRASRGVQRLPNIRTCRPPLASVDPRSRSSDMARSNA